MEATACEGGRFTFIPTYGLSPLSHTLPGNRKCTPEIMAVYT